MPALAMQLEDLLKLILRMQFKIESLYLHFFQFLMRALVFGSLALLFSISFQNEGKTARKLLAQNLIKKWQFESLEECNKIC